jgi:hypothetical protein
MANYISSNGNRFYAAVEQSYGMAAPASASSRFPAVKLQAQQVLEHSRRLDKTGTRTFLGTPKTAKRQTAFETSTYLTSWTGTGEPCYGALIRAGLGGVPQLSGGLVIASATAPIEIQTSIPHGLSRGAGISFQNEIRFVSVVLDAVTILINAPFSEAPLANDILAPCVTYTLGSELPSVTLYDYWDPITAVSRIVVGAAVDLLGITVNGDFHEFTFRGPAADLLDSSSFVPGLAGLATFPTEPDMGAFDYGIVPGHLGQVWLGGIASQFFTLTAASIEINNNIDVRNQEFGFSHPQAIAPGPRQVVSNFTIFAQDDTQTETLYAAAKQRGLLSAMLQLGQQHGELMGIFMPLVTPEIPNFDDSETRLQWHFRNNMAQGTTDDEIFIAFA